MTMAPGFDCVVGGWRWKNGADRGRQGHVRGGGQPVPGWQDLRPNLRWSVPIKCHIIM